MFNTRNKSGISAHPGIILYLIAIVAQNKIIAFLSHVSIPFKQCFFTVFSLFFQCFPYLLPSSAFLSLANQNSARDLSGLNSISLFV